MVSLNGRITGHSMGWAIARIWGTWVSAFAWLVLKLMTNNSQQLQKLSMNPGTTVLLAKAINILPAIPQQTAFSQTNASACWQIAVSNCVLLNLSTSLSWQMGFHSMHEWARKAEDYLMSVLWSGGRGWILSRAFCTLSEAKKIRLFCYFERKFNLDGWKRKEIKSF